jgi:hypothetical protein
MTAKGKVGAPILVLLRGKKKPSYYLLLTPKSEPNLFLCVFGIGFLVPALILYRALSRCS